MSFIISTTGDIASVSFPELGKVFTHPMSAYDLESEFSIEKILSCKSIISAIENNWILAVYNGQVLPLTQPTIGGGAVDSVNGQTGVVVLTTADITESGNLYYTDARVRLAISETVTGIDYNNTTGVFSLTSGYVIPTTTQGSNWNIAYTNRITSLTTTGNSGSATLSSNTLNIPTYTLSGLGGQPLSTNLTSLSGLTYVSSSFVKMTASGIFSLDTSTYLTSNQTITLASEVSGSGSTSINVTLDNAAVIAKVLTGYTSGTGTITSSDSILSAIQKLNGNIAAIPQQHVYVSATFDGQGGVVTTNSQTTFIVPYTGFITEWTLLETSSTPVSSSIVIDAWKDTYANYPPTVANTIFGTKPFLSSAIKNQATGLSIAVTEGELIKLNIDSITSALKVKLIFKIARS